MIRATWRTAISYRMGMVFSVVALVVTFVPIYFVAQALQPVVAQSISSEGGNYFGFLVLGLVAMVFVGSAVGAFPSRLSGAIATGTLEAVLATPTTIPEFIVGLVGYDLLWAGLKAALMLVAGWALGMHVAWQAIPLTLLVLLLVVVAYLATGVMAGAAILVFRTAGPIVPGILAASSLLGGVYYSTSVIPSWIGGLSGAVPLTYGLRAARRALLEGAAPSTVGSDLAVLVLFATALLAVSAVLFGLALRYARKAGTLAHY